MKWLNWIKGNKKVQRSEDYTTDMLTDRLTFHLTRCCDILKQADSGYTPDDEYDLYAIAYVISDFAVYAAGKNREKVSNVILDMLLKRSAILFPDNSINDFRSRIDFYGKVIRGMPLHGHCLPGVDLSDSNPVTSCAIAFCDCLMNPMYIADYNDYWPPMFDAFDAFCVATDIMKPLNSELAALYNDVYTLAQ